MFGARLPFTVATIDYETLSLSPMRCPIRAVKTNPRATFLKVFFPPEEELSRFRKMVKNSFRFIRRGEGKDEAPAPLPRGSLLARRGSRKRRSPLR